MAEKKKVKSNKGKIRQKIKGKPKTTSSVSRKKTEIPTTKVVSGNEAISLSSNRKFFILGIVLLSGIVLVWKNYFKPESFSENGMGKREEIKVQNVGVPQIGGPFVLVNQDGKTVSEADFKGKYMLVYLGYTYCPDVCPTSLTVMEDALNMIGDKAERVTPVFITVDPERDDPIAMKMYVEHFHPRLVGLTGTVNQVKAVAKSYKAYFSKSGDGYDDDDYLIDHSSITYLMAPDGKFVTHFSHGVEAGPMADKLVEIIK